MRALNGMRVNSFTIKAETVVAPGGLIEISADDIKNNQSIVVLATINSPVVIQESVAINDDGYAITTADGTSCTFHTLIVGHN